MFRLIYRWVRHGKNVHVQLSTHFFSPHKLTVIGDNVGIGRYCEFTTDIIIGSNVLIGSRVGMLARDAHRIDIVGLTVFDAPRGDNYRIIVKDDVWIGSGATLLSGVTIGRGSVVAAGALVVKDVAPYSVVAGVPASVVKMRFSSQEILLHERLQNMSSH